MIEHDIKDIYFPLFCWLRYALILLIFTHSLRGHNDSIMLKERRVMCTYYLLLLSL
jgi:hypothetical protein